MNFINDVIVDSQQGDYCNLSGRITGYRNHGKVFFLDLEDSTGKIQIIIEKTKKGFKDFSCISKGSYISVDGMYDIQNGGPEIKAERLAILAEATLPLSPSPWDMDGSDPKHGNQVFGYPGFYVANPQRAAIMKIKSNLVLSLHQYFQNNKFTLVEPPILTDKTLYDTDMAITSFVHGEEVYLSQCATFELEPLAMAFQKVYTISPAFRNEKSGSKRHLAEYTHAKAEVVNANLEDLMLLAGDSIYEAIKSTVESSQRELRILKKDIDIELMHPSNHVHMTYDEALKIVQSKGSHTIRGKGLSRKDEIILTDHVDDRYLWIMYLPFDSEGFPYKRKEDDKELSMTCDLTAPHGSGEMVGVAEKITDSEELIENLIAKGKKEDIKRYWKYILLRKYGMPPHGGLGAAPERIIYGLLDLDHIRLTKPWPRYPDRKINPVEADDLNPWGDADVENLIEKYDLR